MKQDKINIRNLSLKEIKKALSEMGEKPFRGTQIYEWLWQKDAHTFEDMTNLSISLREKIDAHFYIDHIELKDQQIDSCSLK